jgi:hypothetical protein
MTNEWFSTIRAYVKVNHLFATIAPGRSRWTAWIALFNQLADSRELKKLRLVFRRSDPTTSSSRLYDQPSTFIGGRCHFLPSPSPEWMGDHAFRIFNATHSNMRGQGEDKSSFTGNAAVRHLPIKPATIRNRCRTMIHRRMILGRSRGAT